MYSCLKSTRKCSGYVSYFHQILRILERFHPLRVNVVINMDQHKKIIVDDVLKHTTHHTLLAPGGVNDLAAQCIPSLTVNPVEKNSLYLLGNQPKLINLCLQSHSSLHKDIRYQY